MKKKKYLGIATAVLIAVGSAFSSTVAIGIVQEDQVEANTINFKDVTDSKKWYYTPVYWAAENGIVTGTNGYFYPANNCTREQSVTMLWRMAGKPEPKSMTSKFSDVKNKSSFSYKAIMWGSEQGLILGVNGKFNPKGVCTREQIVTMLWRWAGKPLPKSSASKFTDVKKNYVYSAILWANEKGIANGSKGKFSPSANCKRQDIVTFIYRYAHLKKSSSSGGQNNTYTYILNVSSKKFHYPDCSAAKKMSEKNKKTFTGTREYVISSGYSPCKICKP